MDVWLWFMFGLIVLVIGIFLIILYLSRDPERKVSNYDDIVSPADGKIIEILPYDQGSQMTVEKTINKVMRHAEHVARKGIMVTIFTTWHETNLIRSPIKGEVQFLKYVHGHHSNPKDPEAILNNTHLETIIKGKIITKVIQVTGHPWSVAKTFIKPGTQLDKGRKMGRTSFTSQTILVLPAEVDLKVKEGQRVKAGQTLIARYGTTKKRIEDLFG
jgi:phosphatidylserine decarboxylase